MLFKLCYIIDIYKELEDLEEVMGCQVEPPEVQRSSIKNVLCEREAETSFLASTIEKLKKC